MAKFVLASMKRGERVKIIARLKALIDLRQEQHREMAKLLHPLDENLLSLRRALNGEIPVESAIAHTEEVSKWLKKFESLRK